MRAMTLDKFEALLAEDPEYLAAERELRPDLNLANDLIVRRLEHGWTQTELARAVGTNQDYVSRLEGALANPTLRFLKKLANALGAKLDVRLRGQDDITLLLDEVKRLHAALAVYADEERWNVIHSASGDYVCVEWTNGNEERAPWSIAQAALDYRDDEASA